MLAVAVLVVVGALVAAGKIPADQFTMTVGGIGLAMATLVARSEVRSRSNGQSIAPPKG